MHWKSQLTNPTLGVIEWNGGDNQSSDDIEHSRADIKYTTYTVYACVT